MRRQIDFLSSKTSQPCLLTIFGFLVIALTVGKIVTSGFPEVKSYESPHLARWWVKEDQVPELQRMGDWLPECENDRSCVSAERQRRQQAFSPEIRSHIERNLLIQDLAFYDAFTENEIYAFFPPRTKTRIPYAVYENPNLKVFDNQQCLENVFHQYLRTDDSLYKALRRDDEWRMPKSDEAAITVFPASTGSYSLSGCPYESELNKALKDAMSTPEYKAARGMNWTTITSCWTINWPQIDAENQWWTQKSVITRPLVKFLSESPFINSFTEPFTSPCETSVLYDPHNKLYNMTTVESYKYPGGHVAEVKKNRPYDTMFWGQADSRPAYHDRGVGLVNLNTAMRNSVYVRRWVKEGNEPQVRRCRNDDDVDHCMSENPYYVKYLLSSRLGFHFVGDNWPVARLADLMATNTVPIIVGHPFLAVSVGMQCFAPWQKMAVIIDQLEYRKAPRATIINALNSWTGEDYEKAYRLIYYYRRAIQQETPKSYAHRSMMLEMSTKCFSNTYLRSKGIRKEDITCNFEDYQMHHQFPREADEDDVPAYIDGWILKNYNPFNDTSK